MRSAAAAETGVGSGNVMIFLGPFGTSALYEKDCALLLNEKEKQHTMETAEYRQNVQVTRQPAETMLRKDLIARNIKK